MPGSVSFVAIFLEAGSKLLKSEERGEEEVKSPPIPRAWKELFLFFRVDRLREELSCASLLSCE